jgi:hypothetical protein
MERQAILDLWSTANPVVLVTLVRAVGSSYRQQGARLLVCDNGRYAGTISGGFLEADIVRKAQWMIRDGATTVLDGFNEGWITFESDEQHTTKGTTSLRSVLHKLIHGHRHSSGATKRQFSIQGEHHE